MTSSLPPEFAGSQSPVAWADDFGRAMAEVLDSIKEEYDRVGPPPGWQPAPKSAAEAINQKFNRQGSRGLDF